MKHGKMKKMPKKKVKKGMKMKKKPMKKSMYGK
jgi:hypothetical protein